MSLSIYVCLYIKSIYRHLHAYIYTYIDQIYIYTHVMYVCIYNDYYKKLVHFIMEVGKFKSAMGLSGYNRTRKVNVPVPV